MLANKSIMNHFLSLLEIDPDEALSGTTPMLIDE